MATEQTIFILSEMNDILESHYPFRVLDARPCSFASANIYRITTEQGIFCLKEFQTKIKEEHLIREIYVCKHLLDQGFSVPRHVKTTNGSFYFTHKGHLCALYDWLDGVRLPSYSGTKEQIHESAVVYAKLLDAMSSLSIDLPKPDMFDHSPSAIDQSIIEHKSLLHLTSDAKITHALNTKITMLEQMKHFDWSGEEFITWKNSHGDYNPFQFLYQNGSISSVLDFMSARKMPIAFELFRNFLYMDAGVRKHILDHDRLSDYLNVFRQQHALTDSDLNFMIPLYYLRILKSTFGYREYCHDQSKELYLHLGNELFEQCLWLKAL